MRVKTSVARRRSNKRLFREAKGAYGGRRKLIRVMQETLIRARAFAYRDRRVRKREFRRLWISRLSAACHLRDITYSQFIYGLSKANVELDRKSLSELAIHNPPVFDELVASAKAALAG